MSYTGQAPPLVSKEIKSMLEENNTARICSHNKDGTIHAVPVAYRYMNGQIVIASLSSSRKTRNIKRNNNVTVLIDAVNPFRGVLIYGKAELDYDNVYEFVVSLFEKAAPTVAREKVERFTRAYLDTVEFVIVKVTPKHMVTFDYGKDKSHSNLTKTYLE